MEQPKDIIIRKFLNKKSYHGLASVISSLEYDEEGAYITLNITDCSKIIHLDLSTRSEVGLRNSKQKLRILREAIEMLENNIDEAYQWSKFCEKNNK